MPFMPYPTGTVVDPPMATRGMPTMSAPQQAWGAQPAPVAPAPVAPAAPAAPAPVAPVQSAPTMPSADAPMASPFESAGAIAPTGTAVNPRKPYTGSFAFGGGSRSGYAW